METIKVKAQIKEDGILELKIPTGLSAGEVEVVLVLETIEAVAVDEKGWPIGFFERTYGALADAPIERPEQLPLEERDEIE